MNKFDSKKETSRIVTFIKKYFADNNLGGVIIGISGGKDSAVVAALFTKALGKDKVIGVTLPSHSNAQDKKDAQLISSFYGFKLINFDLTKVFDTFKEELHNLGNFSDNDILNSDINLKPRLRMATLYYLSALYTKLKNEVYLVAGTSNKSELYVGYFTKGGDSVHDISVLADFTVDEVIAIGEYLNVPTKVLYKKPSDGLSNQTDEEKLGISYDQIANYMENKTSVPSEVGERIKELHDQNSHKFNIPTYRRNK